MKVQFFAYYRDPEYAGCKEVQIPAVETLRDLGFWIEETYGRKFAGEYFNEDKTDFGKLVIVMVNGRRAQFLNGFETELKDSDTVLIFPVVAGG